MKKLLYILLLMPLFASGQYYIGQHASGGGAVLPTTNLVAYYEGDGTGNTNALWNDLSGHSKNLVQATTANKPTFASPVYTFNNATPQNMTAASIGLTGAYTIYFVVAAPVIGASNSAVVYQDASLTGGARHILLFSNNVFQLTSDGSTTKLNSSTIAAATYYLVRCYFNGASSEIQINNVATVSGSSGTGTQQGAFWLGSDFAAFTSSVNIKAAYLYTGKPTDASVKAYTTSKWALP